MVDFSLFSSFLNGLRLREINLRDNLQLSRHLEAALDWIYLANAANGDGGISKGYDMVRDLWFPSYPETTGYTIPTLLNVSLAYDRPDLHSRALALADYLLGRVTPEGGVAYWASSRSDPVVFDTGQVMFGWLAAFAASGNQSFLQAAERAGDWLVSIQHVTGCWLDGQHLGVAKVIDTRVAWALLLLYRQTGNDTYRKAAQLNLRWAINQQHNDGWLQCCAFVQGQDPITHTIAYTLEGLFECGNLLEEADFIKAAKLGGDALLARQHADGSLCSTYGPSWRETSRSSCLTGNCQMGVLWLRLYETTGDDSYLTAARKAIEFVARTQNLTSSSRSVRGAIAGSFPIYGWYERFKYPNWAAKFFVDALLALDKVENGRQAPAYVG